jgi:hypothetical protein
MSRYDDDTLVRMSARVDLKLKAAFSLPAPDLLE